jgi:hypothetical protein
VPIEALLPIALDLGASSALVKHVVETAGDGAAVHIIPLLSVIIE